MQSIHNWRSYFQFILIFILVFANKLSITVVGCPEQCFCRDSLVDCSGKNLRTLPKGIPLETKSLFLDYNNLNDIPAILVSNLETLSIVGNNISFLNGLQNLKNLKTLNASHNILLNISLGTFHYDNQLELLDLSYNQLENIDGLGDPLHYLHSLYINHNKLSNIDAIRNGRFPSLEIIKAGHNGITDLVITTPVQVNYGNNPPFPKLTTLELNNNKIQEIKWYLKRFVNLKKIVLSHNQLESITLYTFLKNDNIEELYLDHNKLTQVTNKWFAFSTKLNILNLSYNQIDSIDVSAFKNTMKIKHIDISHNRLHSIMTGMFLYLQNLTELNLEHNRIDYIAEHAFFAMEQLRQLNFSNNEISIGEKEFDTAFKPLTMLETLDLSNNKVLLVPHNAFFGLQQLKKLYLKGNDIKYIERNAFDNLKTITELYLESSSLDCDCSIKWFRDWFKSKPLKNSYVTGTCASPAWLKGENMMTILDTELTCVKYESSHSIRPKVIQHPASTYGYLKGNFSLSCTVTSSVENPLVIEWYRGDETLRDSTATVINKSQRRISANLYSRSSTLVQKNIRFEDQGSYWCVARNIYGSDWSHSANMTVIVPPVMSTNLKKEIIMNSGEDVLIPCSAEGIPTPVVHFTKTTGDFFHAVAEKRIVFRNNMFGIQNLKIEDSGLYACIAKSKAGSANATIKLTVIEKPVFVRPMKDKEIAIGSTAVLDCIISGNPRPTVTWDKDGVQLHEASGIKVTDQMLIVSSFQVKDKGVYTCRATNKLGSTSQSARLSVQQSIDEDSSTDDQSKTFIVVIVFALLAVIVITSLFWYIILKFYRRLQKERILRRHTQEIPIMSFTDDLSVPDLPNNFTLRRNGRLISVPSQSEDDDVILNDSVSLPCIRDTLNYLKEQQGSNTPNKHARNITSGRVFTPRVEAGRCSSLSDVDDADEDGEHDSGVLVHYRSGSSFDDSCVPVVVKHEVCSSSKTQNNKNRAFITIDISNKDNRDRRKNDDVTGCLLGCNNQQQHSASVSSTLRNVSLDPKPLGLSNSNNNNNNGHTSNKVKQSCEPRHPHGRRKFSLQHDDGEQYFKTYLTSSSGIESGVSSSSETISVNNQALEETVT